MRRRDFDPIDLDVALRGREFVMRHDELRQLGVSMSSITRRISPHGPWQRMLPGVVLAHSGAASRRELQLAAIAFTNGDGVITGPDALVAHGLRSVQLLPVVCVLVPIRRQRKSMTFVAVERTRHLPDAVRVSGLPYAPAPRALIDSCRRIENLAAVRGLVSGAVQSGLVTVPDLWAQVQAAARPRTALAREVLREVGEGVRSVAEAVARDEMQRSGVPAPLWNVVLFTSDGRRLLSPDAYWPELGLALEIDSYAWHLGPGDYLRTLRRSRQMLVNGIIVLHFAPVEIRDDPERFIREVMAALRLAQGRRAPEGITVRSAA